MGLALAVVSVVMGAQAQSAAAESRHHFGVDVVNLAGTDVDVRFFYGSGDAGELVSEPYGDGSKLPSGAFAVAPGDRSETYAVAAGASEDDHDAGFWVEVSRTGAPEDRTVAKFYRWAPLSGDDVAPIRLTEQQGTSLRIRDEELWSSSSGQTDAVGFHGRLRIVVAEEPGHMVDAGQTGRQLEPEYPAPWDFSTVVGEDGTGWTQLDPFTSRWQLSGLLPQVDYWFRCYRPDAAALSFNGYRPAPAEVGGGVSEGAAAGFWVTSDENGVITVLRSGDSGPDKAVCDVHVAVNDRANQDAATLDARRITGTSTSRGLHDRPIYRFTIPARTRLYPGGVPDLVALPPYVVEGRDAAGGWSRIGVVMPGAAPRISADRTKVTYGQATFYFQNRVGESVSQLRVSGGYGGWSAIVDLGTLPAPTVSGQAIDSLTARATSVIGAATVPLEANGEAQERILVSLVAENPGDITADEAKAILDNVYYRDADGRLVTGMYGEGGSTQVSPWPTASGLAGRTSGGADELTGEAYVSTTDAYAGSSAIVPHIDLDGHNEANEVWFAPVSPLHDLTGSSSAGLLITRNHVVTSASDPGRGDGDGGVRPAVYRRDARPHTTAARPTTVVVSRYRGIASTSSLPRPNIHTAGVAVVDFTVEQEQGMLRQEQAAGGASPWIGLAVVTKSGSLVYRSVPHVIEGSAE